MSAEFKSHILLRDEKGFMGITFKRLLLAGTGGGLTYTLVRIPLPEYALIVCIAVTLVLIVMTGRQGGIPLWMRMIYRLRGALMLMAARQPDGVTAELAHMLNLPVEIVQLDPAQLFAQKSVHVIDFHEWVTFSHAAEADHDDGLRIFDKSGVTRAGDAHE